MNIPLDLWDSEADEETTVEIPAKFEVCHRCDGHGHHDHPAFSNGISQQDFAEDPDFREDYLRGRFDVPCSECHGKNVIAIPDYEAMTPELRARVEKHYSDRAAWRAQEAHERRMGY